jgi:predicted RNA-binding Zn-ribbon protein involved in translation (DUF1610 family)
MTVKTTQHPHGFFFNGVFISQDVQCNGIVSPVSGNKEYACPYCAREITGRDVILLKDCAGCRVVN